MGADEVVAAPGKRGELKAKSILAQTGLLKKRVCVSVTNTLRF